MQRNTAGPSPPFAIVALSHVRSCQGCIRVRKKTHTHTLSHTYSQPVSLYQSEIDRLTGDCSLHYCFWQEMLLLTNKDSIRLRDEHFVLGQRTVLVFSLSSDSLFSLSLPFQVYLFFFSLSLQHSIHLLVGLSSLSRSLFFSLSMCCVPAHRPFPPCSLQPTAETQLQ